MTTLVNFRVNYGGVFYLNKDNEVCYRKGKVHSYCDYDTDLLSKVVLEDMFTEDIGLNTIKEIWFLYPGKKIDLGLRLMDNDISVMECGNAVGKHKMMLLYVVQGDEISPVELRKISPIYEPNSLSIVPSNQLTENPTQKSVHPPPLSLTSQQKETLEEIEADSCGSDSEDDSDDDVDVVGSESSEEGSDFQPEEGDDDEDLFEEHNEFEENVDKHVDDVLGGGVPLVLGDGEAIEEPIDVPDSDDFKSLSDSDGHKIRYPQFNALIDFKKKITFKHGMIFGSNEIFRKALRQYSIETGGDYYYLHNDKNMVYAYCKKSCDCPMVHGRLRCRCKKVLCGFRACARKMSKDGTFQLKSWQGDHECGWQHKNSKVTSEWLADKYLEHHRDDPSWKLQAFINAIKRDHNVHISYTKAWKERFRAMLMTQGDCRAQYTRVYDYALTLRKYNPGSSVFVKVDNNDPENPVFERLYVCLYACKMGFLAGCRPIIGVDGCHLKGAYTGQVFVAVGKDGNDNLFPIAYAVVEAERKDTWLWFIELLLRDVGDCNPTFISDRQKGLLEALDELAPMAEKRACVRHLYQNVKIKWPGKAIKDAIWAAARAYNHVDYNIAMEEIRGLNAECHKYLVDSDPTTWSRHGFGYHTKSDMLLNNICESFNAYILPAREKPILSMLEWIRRTLMKRIVNKKQGMLAYVGKFTPRATKLIQMAKEESTRSCTTYWGGGETFEVQHFGNTYLVNLETKSCGCKRWDLTGIPCPHAICCIMKDRRNVDDFVDSCYTKDTYLKAYNCIIKAMPGDQEWEKSDMKPPLPPKFIVQSGRPKKRRRREAGEGQPGKKIRISKERKCTNCGRQGHYKNKCTNPTKPPPEYVQKDKGGRPSKPSTLPSVTRRRSYQRKNQPQAGNVSSGNVSSGQGGQSTNLARGSSQAGNVSTGQVGTSQGLSRNAPQGSLSQGTSPPATQGACSQTPQVQGTRKSKPYMPVRARNKKVSTSITQLRTSPRTKNKTVGGSYTGSRMS